jgi:hypothetical protein
LEYEGLKMAICVSVAPGRVFSSTTTTIIYSGASSSSTSGSGGVPLAKPAFWAADAVYTSGGYTCSAGAYLLLTPSEVQAISSTPFVASPDHYAAVTAIFGAALTVLCVVWGVKKVLYLLNQHAES